jgi:hypothetical protein
VDKKIIKNHKNQTSQSSDKEEAALRAASFLSFHVSRFTKKIVPLQKK